MKIAQFLAKHEGADEFIVLAGTWLHDVPLSQGSDYNYKRNKQIAKTILAQFTLSPQICDAIIECIAAHEGVTTPKTLEAKIVHDADVLEKSGLLGIIRHTWKLVHLQKIKNAYITDNVIKKITNHIQWRSRRLQIPLARKIHNRMSFDSKPQDIKRLIKTISTLAEQNIITEDIATHLRSDLTLQQWKVLKSQLTLSYLHHFKKVPKKSPPRYG